MICRLRILSPVHTRTLYRDVAQRVDVALRQIDGWTELTQSAPNWERRSVVLRRGPDAYPMPPTRIEFLCSLIVRALSAVEPMGRGVGLIPSPKDADISVLYGREFAPDGFTDIEVHDVREAQRRARFASISLPA